LFSFALFFQNSLVLLCGSGRICRVTERADVQLSTGKVLFLAGIVGFGGLTGLAGFHGGAFLGDEDEALLLGEDAGRSEFGERMTVLAVETGGENGKHNFALKFTFFSCGCEGRSNRGARGPRWRCTGQMEALKWARRRRLAIG